LESAFPAGALIKGASRKHQKPNSKLTSQVRHDLASPQLTIASRFVVQKNPEIQNTKGFLKSATIQAPIKAYN
jgi:hypothetical protein